MDLTPKSSAPWWSVFNCCRPSPTTTSWMDVDAQEYEYINKVNGSTFSLTVVTSGKVVREASVLIPDTPATECTDSSPDVSFESQENDVIDEVAAVPTSKAQRSSASPCKEDVVIAMEGKEEDDFIGEVAVSTPRYATTNKDFSPEDNDTIPNIESSMDANNSQNATDNNTSSSSTQQEDQIEIKFYQFMLLMMLRHMFGSFLPTEFDPMNIFNTRKRHLLTQGGGRKSEKRDFRKTMKLRTLQYGDNNKTCEVLPQLKREEVVGSLTEMHAIDE